MLLCHRKTGFLDSSWILSNGLALMVFVFVNRVSLNIGGSQSVLAAGLVLGNRARIVLLATVPPLVLLLPLSM